MNTINKILIFSIVFFYSYENVCSTSDLSSSLSRKTALVYYDQGTFEHCYQSLCSFFRERNYEVRAINAEEINEETDWLKNSKMKILAFAGGADRFYDRLLNEKGCDNIKKFVENGGTYVGVCGGSYFGTSQVEFALGLPEEVNEPRKLGLFPGIARGPAKGTFKYGLPTGASAALVKITSSGESFYAYHNGGPTFVPFDDDPEFKKADPRFKSYEVLATFSEVEDKPAIIKCHYGEGCAILSGVHFENSPERFSEGSIKAFVTLGEIEQSILSTEDTMNRFLDGIFSQPK